MSHPEPDPVPRAFAAHWATMAEIKRAPATAEAFRRASYLANHAATEEECRLYATEVAVLYRAAFEAVNG
ncbi:hypothetical protein ACFV6D_04195 [Kitasatospora sp. NPDC059812]|uniref:hypothetical protein n=1 Tax=Kitasatospora sp. NPDC059812 TaxID=3346958 RepID=UPI003650E8AD